MQKAAQVPQTLEGVTAEAAEQAELETTVGPEERPELHVGKQGARSPPWYVDESPQQESMTECHGE